jgi:hypothetical protein
MLDQARRVPHFLSRRKTLPPLPIQEGVEQGLEQGERKVLLRQLRRRFGAEVDGEIERRVAEAPTEQIEVWTERVLSAATLAELLAD